MKKLYKLLPRSEQVITQCQIEITTEMNNFQLWRMDFKVL